MAFCGATRGNREALEFTCGSVEVDTLASNTAKGASLEASIAVLLVMGGVDAKRLPAIRVVSTKLGIAISYCERGKFSLRWLDD